jgi:hypothetical protein
MTRAPVAEALTALQARYPSAGWHPLGALLVTADYQVSVHPARASLATDTLRWLASDLDRERLGRTAVEAVEALGRVAS